MNVAIASPTGDADLLKAGSGTHLLPVQVQFRETAPLNGLLLKQRVAPTDRVLALSFARQWRQVSHIVAVVRLVAHALVAGQRVLMHDRNVAKVHFLVLYSVFVLQLIYTSSLDEYVISLGHVAVWPDMLQPPSHAVLEAHRDEVCSVHEGASLVTESWRGAHPMEVAIVVVAFDAHVPVGFATAIEGI